MNLSRRIWMQRTGSLLALLVLPTACSNQSASSLADIEAEVVNLALEMRGFDEAQWAAPSAHPQLAREIAQTLLSHRSRGETIEAALRRVIAEEHASDAVVELQGWVLSNTESQLLRLSATLHVEAGSSAAGSNNEFGQAEMAELAQVERWGPEATCVGQPFNRQQDGHSSLWVSLQGEVPPGVEVAIGDILLPTTRSGGLLTTRVDHAEFEAITRAAAVLPVWLFDSQTMRRQQVGEFRVQEATLAATLDDGSTSTVFQQVENWGPRFATVLTPFNVRGDGSSAFWIRSQCAPASAEVYLGNVRLKSTVGKDLITANLFGLDALKDAGEVPLYLVDKVSGERVLVGQFQIVP